MEPDGWPILSGFALFMTIECSQSVHSIVFEKLLGYWGSSDADAIGLLFYWLETAFLANKKRSARIALRRRGIVSLTRPAAGVESCVAGFYFYRLETVFLSNEKRSARIALRRRGIVSLTRPAAGGESCKTWNGKFFPKNEECPGPPGTWAIMKKLSVFPLVDR